MAFEGAALEFTRAGILPTSYSTQEVGLMPSERIPMRKVRETLRLRAAGLTIRQIAASLVLSIGAVCKYLELAAAAGLSWPLADSVDDSALEPTI